MHTVPILFTFDDKLVVPAGVCITSLLENAGADTFYDIFILHGAQFDFSNTFLTKIPEKYPNCKLTFRSVSNEFVGAYEIRGIPETAYYRLISPELIPEYDKILYSDVDVIFREDLRPYYNIDLGNNYFAGVDNASRFRPDMQKYISGLGIDWKDGYIYSGNLVINLKQIRKDGLCQKFRELGKNDYWQQDMSIINIACNKRITLLGPSFCLTNILYDMIVRIPEKMASIYGEDELKHALASGIVHYNGAKPWKEACMNMDIWWQYYRLSLFFDEKFAFDFWNRQRNQLVDLSLFKRIKLLLRYPLDRRR